MVRNQEKTMTTWRELLLSQETLTRQSKSKSTTMISGSQIETSSSLSSTQRAKRTLIDRIPRLSLPSLMMINQASFHSMRREPTSNTWQLKNSALLSWIGQMDLMEELRVNLRLLNSKIGPNTVVPLEMFTTSIKKEKLSSSTRSPARRSWLRSSRK